jgi:hypothetical protein
MLLFSGKGQLALNIKGTAVVSADVSEQVEEYLGSQPQPGKRKFTLPDFQFDKKGSFDGAKCVNQFEQTS